MTIDATGSDIENDQKLNESPSGVESGSGGDFMEKLIGIVATGGDIDNNQAIGSFVTGGFLDVDGTPLSGSVNVTRGSENLVSKSVAGLFRLSSPPPDAVSSGDNLESQQSDFEFSPDSDGLSVTRENIGNFLDLGTIQYGSVTGTITDVDGNSVQGIGVSGSGAALSTDSNGQYSLLAPGGSAITLSAIGTTEDVSIISGGSTVQDFQLSRLVVEVVTPTGNPVNGVDILVNGKDYRTDQNGKATVSRAFLKTYDIEIGDAIADSLTISSQGSVISSSYGSLFSGVEIEATDPVSGQFAQDVPAKIRGPDGSIASRTTDKGVASPLYEGSGSVEVILSDGDPRYATEVISLTVTSGQIESVTQRLERKDNISTY